MSGSNLKQRLLSIRSNQIGLFHIVISMGHTWQICIGNHSNGEQQILCGTLSISGSGLERRLLQIHSNHS